MSSDTQTTTLNPTIERLIGRVDSATRVLADLEISYMGGHDVLDLLRSALQLLYEEELTALSAFQWSAAFPTEDPMAEPPASPISHRLDNLWRADVMDAVERFRLSATRAADPDHWPESMDTMMNVDLEQLGAAVQQLIGDVRKIVAAIVTAAEASTSSGPTTDAAQFRDLVDRADALALRQRTRELQLSAQEMYDEARSAISESTGKTAELSLAASFEALADEQAKAADTWRIVAILGFAVLLIVGAVTIVLGPPAEGWALLRKVLVAVPGAGLVAYAIHESSQHRKREAWASDCSVLLRSVRAYTEDLPDASRYEVRHQLGLRVFLVPGPIPEKADSVVGMLSGAPTQRSGPADLT